MFPQTYNTQRCKPKVVLWPSCGSTFLDLCQADVLALWPLPFPSDMASPVCQWDLCELDRLGLPGIGYHRNKQCIKQDKWDHWIFSWPKFPEKFCVKGLVTRGYDKTLRVLMRALNGTEKGSFHIWHLTVSLVSAQEMLLPSHLTVLWKSLMFPGFVQCLRRPQSLKTLWQVLTVLHTDFTVITGYIMCLAVLMPSLKCLFCYFVLIWFHKPYYTVSQYSSIQMAKFTCKSVGTSYFLPQCLAFFFPLKRCSLKHGLTVRFIWLCICYVAQSGPKFTILPSLPCKCWN